MLSAAVGHDLGDPQIMQHPGRHFPDRPRLWAISLVAVVRSPTASGA
jgi:hypothetical protein